MPPEERLRRIEALSQEEVRRLPFIWELIAREEQLAPPGRWLTWMVLAGRGFGKTRAGAEWVRSVAESGKVRRIALVAPTAADVRDVMVEGESGIMAISPPWFLPLYQPSKRRLTWPNGVMGHTYSADEPERLRGPQHGAAWCDEPASWRYPEAMDMLMFGLRLGKLPRRVVTGTPKPVKLIKEIVQDAKENPQETIITGGPTYDNLNNLSPAYRKVISRYEGTRLGRQELLAEILEDLPGALWNRALIEQFRVKKAPHLKRIVVGVDPAVTAEEDSDETGLVVVGRGVDGHAYLLDDVSCRKSPLGWARAAVNAYWKWEADRIVGEVNQGGDMVETTIRTIDPTVSYKGVHATRGKYVRAEPVAALAEQGKIHHVGCFPQLEDQLCSMTPDGYEGGGSPDRADAYVWAITELMLDKHKRAGAW
ncbi:MAG: terminase family protein [Thermodesulfobacteriota bacterium]